MTELQKWEMIENEQAELSLEPTKVEDMPEDGDNSAIEEAD